jgi:hypothetical protein
MEFKSECNPRIRYTPEGKVEITFTTYKSEIGELSKLKDKELNVKVSKFVGKHSLSQNSYMWRLITDLSNVLKTDKNLLYKRFIQSYGQYDYLPLNVSKIARFVEKWESNGSGYFVEECGKSKLEGYVKLKVYYGSSSYNTKEMKQLIDGIIEVCKRHGVDTLSESEIMLLKNENDIKE